jgi:hypothetical protein
MQAATRQAEPVSVSVVHLSGSIISRIRERARLVLASISTSDEGPRRVYTAHAPHEDELEDLMKKPGSRFSVRVGARGPLRLLLLLPVLAVSQGCSLDENPTSVITPTNFYQNEAEVLGGLASVYAVLRTVLEDHFIMGEITTDEMVVPTRGQDWFDNGRWLELHQQSWAANSPAGLADINTAWNRFFGGVANANVVLEGLQNVTVSDQEVFVAELRTLRALYYYSLLDFFGGVPIATDPEILARPRPTRAELFDFIEQELTQARNDLPTSWPANMNGRLTKGAADALLASLYLNAEVFTGTVSAGGLQRGQARWQDAIDAAERVINSGVYSLAADWTSIFTADNFMSPEPILVVKHLNQSGLGYNFMMRTLHYNQISPTPWNGWSTLADTYAEFDEDDERREIFLVGPQVNLDTGEPVTDRQGNPLVYTPINDITQASESEGIRIWKWPADPNRVQQDNANDVALYRLAEMYLIQAEALNELGNTAAAVDRVNTIRERVFDPDKPLNPGDFSQATFRDQILMERLFELFGETKRRADLVRHDKFTMPWKFKPQTEPYKILFPIPQPQLDINPELVQNPGY